MRLCILNLLLMPFLAFLTPTLSFGETVKLGDFSAQVDLDAVAQLNDQALQIFPFLPSTAEQAKEKGVQYVDNETLKQTLLNYQRNPEFQAQYQDISKNAELLLITKGIAFTDIPQMIPFGRSLMDKTITKETKAYSPLLEKIFAEVFRKNSDDLLKAIRRNDFLDPNKSSNSPASSYVNEDFHTQALRMYAMEACALKNAAEDLRIQKIPLTEEICLSLDQKVLKNYQLMMSSLYASYILIKKHRGVYGDFQSHYSFGAPFCIAVDQTLHELVQTGSTRTSLHLLGYQVTGAANFCSSNKKTSQDNYP